MPDPHPQKLKREFDRMARMIVRQMTPLEIGKRLYPSAIPVARNAVPKAVVKDHLNRYTKGELKEGQFFEVLPGKYTFIMGHKAYRRREPRGGGRASR